MHADSRMENRIGRIYAGSECSHEDDDDDDGDEGGDRSDEIWKKKMCVHRSTDV